MKIEYVNPENLRPAKWRTTYMFSIDNKLLEASMRDFGWLAPIVVRVEDSTIIDGHSRWVIASRVERLTPIPVIWVSCDEVDAMVMHVRLNRSRGQIVNKALSDSLKAMIASGKYGDIDLARFLGMTLDEFDILADGSLIKSRKIGQHVYSLAWVPIESGHPDAIEVIKIERPPDDDQA